MPTQSLTSLMRWLRKHFPTKAKIRVRTVKPHPDLHGETSFYGAEAVIRISRASLSQMEESLLEEWSHCLRAETPVPWDDNDHDAIFWAILGAVTMKYRES